MSMPLCYAVHLYYEKCFNVISIKSTFFNHQIIMDKIINTRWKKHCELQSKTIWDLSLNSQSTRTAAWAHGGPLSATVCSNQLFLWHSSSICNSAPDWLAFTLDSQPDWLAYFLGLTEVMVQHTCSWCYMLLYYLPLVNFYAR